MDFLSLQSQPIVTESPSWIPAPVSQPAVTGLPGVTSPTFTASTPVTTVAPSVGAPTPRVSTIQLSTVSMHSHPVFSHLTGLQSSPMSTAQHDPSSMGLGGQPPYGSTPGSSQAGAQAPASLLADPPTIALHQLSNMADHDSGARPPGMHYRPEYYCQHKLENVSIKQVDHRKLTFKQLIYGMNCVAHHVLGSGGNIDSYLHHMEFVSRYASDNSFVDCSYSEYDKCVADNYLRNP